MGYIIYLIICGFNGIILSKLNMSIRDWKFWALIFNTPFAYCLGKYF